MPFCQQTEQRLAGELRHGVPQVPQLDVPDVFVLRQYGENSRVEGEAEAAAVQLDAVREQVLPVRVVMGRMRAMA